MTEAELHSLIMMSADQIDSAFEFWLTISFGVVIAIHITRDSIGMHLRTLICALYVAASSVAVLLTIGDIMQIYSYARQLSIPLGGIGPSGTSDIIRLVVYVVGTVSVATAIFRYSKWVGKDPQ